MATLITVLQVFCSLLIITFVLLQPSKGGSFFAGSSQGVFGSSGGLTFFFKATMWLMAVLMFSSLFLSWQKIHESKSSVVESTPISAPDVDSAAIPTNTTEPTNAAVPAEGAATEQTDPATSTEN